MLYQLASKARLHRAGLCRKGFYSKIPFLVLTSGAEGDLWITLDRQIQIDVRGCKVG